MSTRYCAKWARSRAVAFLCAAATQFALAGGTPENALLIIDPTDRDSMYVGNYYRQARGIPDTNILYMAPGAANYIAFADYNLDALFGMLANAGTEDHIDYIVLLPGAPFYVSATNQVQDQCSPVRRFSISAAYTMAFIADEILTGTLWSTNMNRYYGYTDQARAFDSSVAWLYGDPSNAASARRYFIGAMLGYSGERGNTVAETIAMIDRAVAADGTRPAGTFYFMKTTDELRSGPRDPYFPAAVNAIIALGGQAEQLLAVLPEGRHDCLGIMTGWAAPNIDGANMTIRPGAIGDHLTSWAATFDNASQTKVSRWIAKGAAGSWGTVEEPCNYAGKFPHARAHVYYFQGLSLGEALFRSVAYTPFQGLLYGDPLTRPFAHLPAVQVPDAPTGPVAGNVTLTPSATTTHPTAQIAGFDLLIDGVLRSSVLPGQAFNVNTRALSDGRHDVRVLAYDNTLVRSTGRWLGTLDVQNRGQSVSMTAAPLSGNWATAFNFDVVAAGGVPREIRLVQNGRVLAAAPGAAGRLTIYGLTLGAGPAQVQAEALFLDGRAVRSAPALITVSYAAGNPASQPPTAFSFTKRVRKDQPFVVELPAAFNNAGVPLTFEIVSSPVQVSVPTGQSGPYRLMRPLPGAKGIDAFTYRVRSSAGDSNVATVTLELGILRGDLNCDGRIDFGDINAFVLALANWTEWKLQYPDCPEQNADVNGDGQYGGVWGFGDINPFVDLLAGGW